MTTDEIKKAIFAITDNATIEFESKVKLNQLIYDLDLKAYLNGLDRGREICQEVYGSKSKPDPQ